MLRPNTSSRTVVGTVVVVIGGVALVGSSVAARVARENDALYAA